MKNLNDVRAWARGRAATHSETGGFGHAYAEVLRAEHREELLVLLAALGPEAPDPWESVADELAWALRLFFPAFGIKSDEMPTQEETHERVLAALGTYARLEANRRDGKKVAT